jgi:hypothetical protein
MLIVALVLAVIGLAALVTAVVTSNELIAWVCIAASVIGVVLLIVDAVRECSKGDAEAAPAEADDTEAQAEFDEEYPDEPPVSEQSVEPDGESDAETTAVVTEQFDEETSDEERR